MPLNLKKLADRVADEAYGLSRFDRGMSPGKRRENISALLELVFERLLTDAAKVDARRV
jgi:hypothetical protein